MRALPPLLALALCVASTASADPLGRERLKEVLAKHGQSEPLVVMAELAKQGNLTIDRSDAIAGAISAPVSPAVRTWLGNTQRIRTQDGRLQLKADQRFRVPTQNGAQLEFLDRFRLDLQPEGRVSTRGLGVRPQGAAQAGPVKGALLDPKGIYAFDLGRRDSPERIVQLRPKVEAPPAQEQPEEAPASEAAPSQAAPSGQLPAREPELTPERLREWALRQPRYQEQARRASMPREQEADPAPASAPRSEQARTEQPESAPVELAPAKRYQTGPHVEALEERLAALGFEIEPDRFFDWQTQKALSDFQSERGLPASGELDEATIAALGRAPSAPAEVAPAAGDAEGAAAEAERERRDPVEGPPARSRPHPEAEPSDPASARSRPHPEAEELTPPSGASEGSEDRLRRIFGLEGGGEARSRPLGAGSEGVAVRDLQRRLEVAGQPLKVDGKFGPGTTKALQAFQREQGLEPSGQLDAETDAALTRAARAPRVAQGDRGPAARRLQEALRRRGARLRPDGVFGAKSAAALKRFQEESGLEPTGVADADTWEALDTLRRGDRGDEVRELQEALNRVRGAQGKPKIGVDGKFGPGTEAAIQELQGELGEEADGRVSPQLLDSLRRAKLQGIVAKAEDAERRKAPLTSLGEGDRGPEVKALQQDLRRHGIPLNPDGRFGPGTRKALERFQRQHDLPATGVADEETRNALRGLVRGDEGEDVKDLQRLINHQRRIAGLDELPIDGKYGSGTAEAISEIQRDLELPSTGRADKPLIDALTTAREEDTQPILRPGDRGKSVARLQERLNAHREAAGLPKIRETGNFDKDTRTALATFQRGRDLPASGETDAATWGQLDGQPPADVRARPLREGDEHDEVALLQDKLNMVRRWRGERPIGVDGKFGPGTREAIEGFQRQHELPATGRADAETVAALDQATAGSYRGDFPKQAQYKPFSPEARQLFVAAARLVGVPEEWAHSQGLHQILKRESNGMVGVPNYTYGRRKTNRASWASVHAELRRGRKRAKSSATGLGQLLLGNVDKYYPQGRAGIGDPLNEAAGMLAYIKARYGTPARAWQLYGKLHEGY